MPASGAAQRRETRGLGIILLILSLMHTPLPQPDFHNIRHHDGAGELCEHHDHLLRWHPGAGLAEDVAVLHWHWFVPTSEPAETPSHDGPALHAHVSDWFASSWDTAPRVVPDSSSRLIVRPPLHLLSTAPADLAGLGWALALPARPGPSRPHTSGATAAPLNSLLQRWVC